MNGADVGPSPIIRASGIGRRFRRRWALKDVSIAVGAGEIFGLVGPDGAGKTTLLQILAAILDPTEGACEVLGFDALREASKVTSRIGYMAQGFTLYDQLTVDENIAFAAKIRGVRGEEYRSRRAELLKVANLGRFLGRREGRLSGGMRKKLALCANLIHKPALLLLDEPGLGVDPLSRAELWAMLQRYRALGTTVVFTTSYMDEAEACDRVAILDDGKVAAVGAPRDLLDPLRDRVFQVRAADAGPVRAFLDADVDVIAVQPRPDATRFQVATGGGLRADLAAHLDGLGAVSPAAPTFEDVFSSFARRDQDAAAAPAPRGGLEVESAADRKAPAVQTNDLTRIFGKFVAVDGVTFRAAPGEVLGLLGPNGAGKTTLIRMLCGLLPPSSGAATVAGWDIASAGKNLKRSIGYMSQRFSLYPDLTMRENLDFFASVYGLGRTRARERIDWAAAATGLAGLHDDLVGSYSGAVRQRIALACSILHQPRILFLDEPTSGVDPIVRYRFWSLVDDLGRSGMTVLVTTHYLEEAEYCHTLGLMYDGRLVGFGSLDRLRQELGLPADASADAVFRGFIERERSAAHAGFGQARAEAG